MDGRPCLVGLTGGLASGKSTVARLLADRNVPVFDADHEVHRLYEPGRPGAAAVAELFGRGMLDAAGGVDRPSLASRVLGDGEALEQLNRAIHPLVREAVERWVTWLSGTPDPPPIAVVEAALLVETGGARSYDVLVVVGCRPDQQLERALERGMDDRRARGLLVAQMPIDVKVAVADVAVDNSRGEAELAAEVERAWREIERLCKRRRRGTGLGR